jgi:hypothetical protein
MLCARSFASDYDFEYWQTIEATNWENNCYRIYTNGEARLNHDITRPYYYRLSECFAYHATPNLDLEVHYTFVYNKSRGASHFTNKQRIEFESDATFQLYRDTVLKWRNRFEIIKKQSDSKIEYVAREKFKIVIPVENWGSISSVVLWDEFYYDLQTHFFTQNRFVPFSLTFDLTCHTSLNAYVMVRNFQNSTTKKWYRSLVLGTEIDF